MSEATPTRKNLSSILLYIGVAFLAFFPCLVLGKAYYANDLLYSHSHFRAFLRTELFSGHFPLWNPYLQGGRPFFADPDVMMCYPLNYLTLIFPIPYGLSVFFFLHMVLAATGAHFWLKSLRVPDTACRLASLSFALSGVFAWELIHPMILAGIAWFPWMLFCLEKTLKTLKPLWAFLTGLCFAVVFTCGSFQTTTSALYGSFAYFLFRLFTREETQSPGAPGSWKKWGVLFLFAVWGGFPLFGHFIPAEEFSRFSNRRGENPPYETFAGTFSMVPRTSYEFFFPSLGVPEGQTLEDAIQNVTDTKNMDNDFLGATGFLGVWAPFLMGLAFFRKEKKIIYFLAGVGFLSILTAWGRYFPLHELLCHILPGVGLSRAPFRFILTYVLFASALAAFGLQTLEKWTQEKERKSFLAVSVALYGGLLLVAGFFHPLGAWREMLALGVGTIGILLWIQTQTWKPLGKMLFQAAVVGPLVLSAWGGYSTGDVSNFDTEARFPAYTYLKQNTAVGRYFFDPQLAYPVQVGTQNFGWPFPEDSILDHKIRSAGGYDPFMVKNYEDLRKLPMPVFFHLMAVRGFLTPQAYPDSKEYTHRDFDRVHLYEFTGGPAYFTAPFKVQVIPEDAKALEALAQPTFKPEEDVILSESLPASIVSSLTGKPTQAALQVLKDDPDEQSFQVHVNNPTLAVFSELNFPGWKAWVDLAPAPLFTANHAFRAVYLPSSGDHKVEFRFQPPWFKPILLAIALWVLSALAFGFLQWKKQRGSALEPVQS